VPLAARQLQLQRGVRLGDLLLQQLNVPLLHVSLPLEPLELCQ
jgi:hypothetical protein